MSEQTRRDFIQQAALGTAALLAYPPAHVLGANDRVRVGMIGVGGRGRDLLKQVVAVPNVELVAIADVYSRRRDEARQMAPHIRTFDDHRRLLELKEVDAVIVASPLHTHARHFVDTLAGRQGLVRREDDDVVHPGGRAVPECGREFRSRNPDRIAARELRRVG